MSEKFPTGETPAHHPGLEERSGAELEVEITPTPMDKLAMTRDQYGLMSDEYQAAEKEATEQLTQAALEVSAAEPDEEPNGAGVNMLNRMMHMSLNHENGHQSAHTSFPEADVNHLRTITSAYPNPGDLINEMREDVEQVLERAFVRVDREKRFAAIDRLAAAVYGDRYEAFKAAQAEQQATSDGDSEASPESDPLGGGAPEQASAPSEEQLNHPPAPDKEITERETKADEILGKSQQLRMGIRSEASNYQYNVAMTIANAKNMASTPKNLVLGYRHNRAKDRYERRFAKVNSSRFKVVNALHEHRATKAYNKYQARKLAHEGHNAHMEGRVSRVKEAKELREQAIEGRKTELMNKKIEAQERKLHRQRQKIESQWQRRVAQQAQGELRGSSLSHAERTKRVAELLERRRHEIAPRLDKIAPEDKQRLRALAINMIANK